MTGILTHPGRTLSPILIIVAAFVTAALVTVVLALSVWSSDGGTDVDRAPRPVVRGELPCKLYPC